jgi:hypothetical protein
VQVERLRGDRGSDSKKMERWQPACHHSCLRASRSHPSPTPPTWLVKPSLPVNVLDALIILHASRVCVCVCGRGGREGAGGGRQTQFRHAGQVRRCTCRTALASLADQTTARAGAAP